MKEIEKGLVSVLMPAYNAEQYIGEAIQSVLQQTYSNFELIVVEDCSTDCTLNEIKKINDRRIKVIVNDRNYGIAYTTNRCIQESRGEYLALLDDDDVALPRRLELTVEFLKKHLEIDIVGGAAVKIDEKGNMIGNLQIPRKNPKILAAQLLLKDTLINGTVTMRRNVVEEHGIWYEEKCLGMQDFLFFAMASKKVRISNVSDIILKYRSHSGRETVNRKSNDAENREKKYREIQRKSLDLSGYSLSESEYDTLFDTMAESQKSHYTMVEMNKLKNIFAKLISQAREMDKDYISELEWQCKYWLGERLPRVDIFKDKGKEL